MKNNVLITSAGKRVALTKYFKETLNRFLGDAKVFITDMNPDMAPVSFVADGSFKVPRVTADGYVEELLRICRENNVGMVIPTIDTELLILSKVKKRFDKEGITIIVSDKTFIDICRDKRKLTPFMLEHGLRVPRAVDKNNPIFPMFAKPYDGSLSANIHIIRSSEELTPQILSDPKLMFMEYIDKSLYKEFTIDLYYGRDNTLKCVVPRERIEIRAGEINKGRTDKNKIVDTIKHKFHFINGCVGCICMQVFFNNESEDIIGIEINPRFGGGYPLSYMAGANFPELLIREYFMDERINYFEDWTDKMLMLRFDDAFFV